MATAIVQSGIYVLEMATGNQTNEFILNQSLLNGANVLGGETEFADITADLQTITMSRGRRKPVDQFRQATYLSQPKTTTQSCTN